ncbi:glycosyltransferase [Robertmurraya massiliosenegalensis]|uniref:glycosyltransferase n=1 Tax=Robertmurraya massiliosenegalensis TaxID=1287657 RepID=UPI0002DBF142|nr:glycosyltransferase [Robertmurraya massiliosenegalensis]
MKKICMIVAEHPFLDSRIFRKEAKSLHEAGYEVTMIVPRKKGYLFDINGQPLTDKFLEPIFVHEGIKMITYSFEKSRPFLNKVLEDESKWEKEAFPNPLTTLAIQENADIYHAHEYLSLFAGIGIKRLMKKTKGKEVKLIYDSHELVPDPLDKRYSDPAKKKLKEKLLFMLKEVDHIITVSDSIKNWYQREIPQLPVEVIYNTPPLSVPTRKIAKNGFTICYEGSIEAQKGNIKKIIGISEICSRAIKNFQFKIIGGPRYGESIHIPKFLKNKINMTGWVEYQDIQKHMTDVDVGWIDFDDLANSLNRSYALPNKFFSYLNNGVPILVNKAPEMERVVKQHQCGHVVEKPHATAKDFANAIIYLYHHKSLLEEMRENARTIMENVYSWDHMKKRLLAVYANL